MLKSQHNGKELSTHMKMTLFEGPGVYMSPDCGYCTPGCYKANYEEQLLNGSQPTEPRLDAGIKLDCCTDKPPNGNGLRV